MATDVHRGVFKDYRTVFESSPDGILVVDGEGRICELNPRAAAMLGYHRDELMGEPIEVVVPPDVRGRHVALRDRFMEEPASRPMGVGMELRAARKDGRVLPVEVALRPCLTESGRYVIAVMRDMSAQRRLRTLGTGTLRATEEERQRIARELHDDTAQSLAALMVQLKVLAQTHEEAARDRIMEEMHSGLETLVQGVRRIARGLRPPALEDVGIEAALRVHIRQTFRTSEPRVDLHLEAVDAHLGSEQQLAVYRVVQEALANVLRHAEAAQVEVRLAVEGSGDNSHVVATIRDDGRGFDAEGEFLAGAGLGLVGMDERAHLAGGRLTLHSAPGEGCLVRLTVPARRPTAAALPGHAPST
ncbi:MAG: PAS domain S-box protein [Gemmatimonadota bacterium]